MDYQDMLQTDAHIALAAAKETLERPIGAQARIIAAAAMLEAYPNERTVVIGKLLGFPVPNQCTFQLRAALRNAHWVRQLAVTHPYIWDHVLGAVMEPEYGDRL